MYKAGDSTAWNTANVVVCLKDGKSINEQPLLRADTVLMALQSVRATRRASITLLLLLSH